MHWLWKCVIGLVLATTTWSSTVESLTQKRVPPGPGLSLNDSLSVNSSELDSHVIELPYKGGDISLFVILPNVNKEHGISQLSKRLSTNTIQNIVSSSEWTSQWVEVSMPKFNATHAIDNLAQLLVQMGLGETSIHYAVHKAVISMVENGTTATGATGAVDFMSLSPSRPIKFRCNHPFIYFVFHKEPDQ